MKSYSANMFVSLLTVDQQQHNNYDHFSQLSPDLNENNQDPSTTAIIVDKPSDVNERKILNEVDTRETWSTNFDYLITTLGGLIGLGKYL